MSTQADRHTKLNAVSEALQKTEHYKGMQFTPIGRGYCFRHVGERVFLRELTAKSFWELSVDEIVALAPAAEAIAVERSLAPDEESDDIRYDVETKEGSQNWNDSGFRHRVVCSDGRHSGWAGYEEVAYLDNVASLTPYHVGGDKAVTRSITEALTYIAVGPENVTEASAESAEDELLDDTDSADEFPADKEAN